MAKKEETKEVVKEEKAVWAVGEVPTATQPVLVNTATEQQHDIPQALAQILNKLEKLEKLL